MDKLTGRVAIVSGAGRGIGRAVALKLAAEGAGVVVNGLDPEAAEETVAAVKSAGGDAVYLLCTPESDYISGQVVVCGGGFTL